MNFGSGNFPRFYLNLKISGFVSNFNEGHHTNSQTQKIYKIIIKAKTNKLETASKR